MGCLLLLHDNLVFFDIFTFPLHWLLTISMWTWTQSNLFTFKTIKTKILSWILPPLLLLLLLTGELPGGTPISSSLLLSPLQCNLVFTSTTPQKGLSSRLPITLLLNPRHSELLPHLVSVQCLPLLITFPFSYTLFSLNDTPGFQNNIHLLIFLFSGCSFLDSFKLLFLSPYFQFSCSTLYSPSALQTSSTDIIREPVRKVESLDPPQFYIATRCQVIQVWEAMVYRVQACTHSSSHSLLYYNYYP